MAIFILRIYLYPRYFLEYSGDVFFRMAMKTIVRVMLFFGHGYRPFLKGHLPRMDFANLIPLLPRAPFRTCFAVPLAEWLVSLIVFKALLSSSESVKTSNSMGRESSVNGVRKRSRLVRYSSFVSAVMYSNPRSSA